MDEWIIKQLSAITPEEQKILDGQPSIDRQLYMQGFENVINSKKLLSAGKLITIRPHTRFVHFPEHTHDYVEMIYMCKGSSTHIVNGHSIELSAGELLLLNQSATHEVCATSKQDVAVNVIILPYFFTDTLEDVGTEKTPLRTFLVDCLCGKGEGPDFFHFCVSEVKPIQNLVENLLWTLLGDGPNKRKASRLTMSLLFLELTAYMQNVAAQNQEDAAVIAVLSYVEANYTSGNLLDIATQLHYDVSWLSREVKRKTGKTFTQILQEKRLSQAAFLLRNTNRKVLDISIAVGYENASFFHKLFQQQFGCSPRQFRLNT